MPFTYGRLILTGTICSRFSVLSLFTDCLGSCDEYCCEMIFFFFFVGRVADDVLCSVK